MKSLSISVADTEADIFGVENISCIETGKLVYEATGAPGRLAPRWCASDESPIA